MHKIFKSRSLLFLVSLILSKIVVSIGVPRHREIVSGVPPIIDFKIL